MSERSVKREENREEGEGEKRGARRGGGARLQSLNTDDEEVSIDSEEEGEGGTVGVGRDTKGR